MEQNNLTPNIGEIWQLMPHLDWANGIVLDITDNGEFVTAKIISHQLPANYVGPNIEINDSFSGEITAPFVIYIDKTRILDRRYFEFKRSRLNDNDWQTVYNAHLNLAGSR